MNRSGVDLDEKGLIQLDIRLPSENDATEYALGYINDVLRKLVEHFVVLFC